jgi:ribosomal protein L7/L12
MGKARQKFEQKDFDEKEYQRYFHVHQSEYLRKRLRIIKMYRQNARIESKKLVEEADKAFEEKGYTQSDLSEWKNEHFRISEPL